MSEVHPYGLEHNRFNVLVIHLYFWLLGDEAGETMRA